MSLPTCLSKREQDRSSNKKTVQTKKLDLPDNPAASAKRVVSRTCRPIISTINTKNPHGAASSKTYELDHCCTSNTQYIFDSSIATRDESANITQPPTLASTIRPAPIRIPPPTLHARDINRVPTPLSGRGARKEPLFPFEHSYSRSPSPRRSTPRSYKITRTYSNDSDCFFGQLEQTLSTSSSSTQSIRSRCGFGMHEAIVGRGYPASPLSPKFSGRTLTGSPEPSQRRGNHGRQTSRNMQLNLGRFHPSRFAQADITPSGATPALMQAPSITYTRAPPPTQVESPRLMREKHREFLDKTRLSSKLAASPLTVKPDAPRLDPLGSPKGPVTPLALAEEAADYFGLGRASKVSPVGTPRARSPRSIRSSSVSSDEDLQPKKNRKIEIYP